MKTGIPPSWPLKLRKDTGTAPFTHPHPMRKTLLIILLLTARPHVWGQTFTEHIRDTESGKGRVIITQSERIETLVNGKPHEEEAEAARKPAASAKNETSETPKSSGKPTTAYNPGTRQRYKAKGFRIQVFTGGNSRTDKDNAARAGRKIKSAYPELSVYAHFVSPRWVCRVGDFRSREDAEKYVALIRRDGLTQECHIVACTVLLAR